MLRSASLTRLDSLNSVNSTEVSRPRRQSFTSVNMNGNGHAHHEEESGNATAGSLNASTQIFLNELSILLSSLAVPSIQLDLAPTESAPFELKKLTQLFTDLSRLDKTRFNDKQILSIENAKLAIMRIALAQVGDTTPITTLSTSYTSYMAVIGALILGVLYSAAESFTGSYDLVSSIFGLTVVPAVVTSIIFALMSNILFFALEARGFMDEANIQSPFNFNKVLEIYKNKLQIAKIYSRVLRSPQSHNFKIDTIADFDRYQENVALLRLIQEDIKEDQRIMQPRDDFMHRRLLPALQYISTAVGSLLYACAGIIIGRDFIANITTLLGGASATSLGASTIPLLGVSAAVGHLIALSITAVLTLAGFVMYFALQHRGVINMVNDIFGRPDEFINDQATFCNDIDSVNENIDGNIHSSFRFFSQRRPTAVLPTSRAGSGENNNLRPFPITGDNIYRFMRHSRSFNSLSTETAAALSNGRTSPTPS